jgi:adenylate kinase
MGSLIVLMGPTGAGKSVQGDLLAARNNWVHLSSGKLLRADPHAAEQLRDGSLAPAEEVERVVGEALAKVPGDQVVVLDGTPRTESNITWLEQELSKLGRELKRVVMIRLSLEISVKRLSTRGRADDSPDAIRAKWELFDEVTRPVAEHYRKLGLLTTIDGSGTIEEVHQLIEAALEEAAVL